MMLQNKKTIYQQYVAFVNYLYDVGDNPVQTPDILIARKCYGIAQRAWSNGLHYAIFKDYRNCGRHALLCTYKAIKEILSSYAH